MFKINPKAIYFLEKFASVLMIIFTIFWTYWGIAEMYHEGWWGAWYNRMPYLAPIALCMLPAFISFRWPRIGGLFILAIGIFSIFFFGGEIFIIFLGIAFVGFCFLVYGCYQKDFNPKPPPVDNKWWLRQWRYILLFGMPLLIFLGISIYMLPIVLTRVDDGNRDARLIQGNGVELIWAPEGPGWNWKQSWGGYPSWHTIALYGVSPIGVEAKPGYGRQNNGDDTYIYATAENMQKTNLCLFLSEDGRELLDEPQNIWRMPTTEEVVRSLVRNGENAGCEWHGELRKSLRCNLTPDKESPLWATDHPVIYYWTVDSFSDSEAYFVSFNGMVNTSRKSGGNPRHSYRCVKEP